ncbi:MAG: 2-hydroxyacyl-CoA dehydratase [Promethearchaeota archaeon]|nr:MAG: 2-hydroxyacyl-CoA dehydratase [Candidatus Lokiarchaeota archaeon]
MNLHDDPFLKISNRIFNRYIAEWQERNKKVIGHYCTYIPEELLYAADLLPFRIRATGHEHTDLADIYMVRFTCSFVRATLDMALRGAYDFLDGFLVCNSCDHSRRMFELFDLKVFKREGFTKQVPRFYVSMPHVITEEGFKWYKKEIEELKEDLENNITNQPISDNDLQSSIEIHNENRSLLRKIHELRILDSPKLNGTEALQISISNASIPKDIANNELKRIYNFLKEMEGIKGESKRIMLIGSEVDDITFTKLIENSGAILVSDFLCFGTRNFLDDVKIDVGSTPLENIVKRVYYRMSCPRMMDDHIRRLQFLKSEISKAKVDGIILQTITNCDLAGCENMMLLHELKELDIPILNIDREFYQSDTTRLQTRIEAFLEMIS